MPTAGFEPAYITLGMVRHFPVMLRGRYIYIFNRYFFSDLFLIILFIIISLISLILY